MHDATDRETRNMREQTAPPQEQSQLPGSPPAKVWTPGTIGATSFLLGSPGGLLLLGINRWRMGLKRGAQNLMIVSAAGFLLYALVVILAPGDMLECVAPLINIAVAYVLYQRAAADRRTFEAASGELTTANWLIGAVVGLGGTLVFLVMWIGVSAIALHLAVLAGVTIPD